MKLVIIYLILFIVFIGWSLTSKADQFDFKYGLEFGMPNQVDTAESKLVALEYQDDLNFFVQHKIGIGAWFDDHPEFKRTNSTFISYSIGIQVLPGFFYLENFFGIAYIGQTDSMLSSNLEFIEEIGIGMQDMIGRFIGIEYRHFSNAGISLPNKGRDFILINTGIHF